MNHVIFLPPRIGFHQTHDRLDLLKTLATKRTDEIEKIVAETGYLTCYGRLVRPEKQSNGKSYGHSGKKIGNAHLRWVFGQEKPHNRLGHGVEVGTQSIDQHQG